MGRLSFLSLCHSFVSFIDVNAVKEDTWVFSANFGGLFDVGGGLADFFKVCAFNDDVFRFNFHFDVADYFYSAGSAFACKVFNQDGFVLEFTEIGKWEKTILSLYV